MAPHERTAWSETEVGSPGHVLTFIHSTVFHPRTQTRHRHHAQETHLVNYLPSTTRSSPMESIYPLQLTFCFPGTLYRLRWSRVRCLKSLLRPYERPWNPFADNVALSKLTRSDKIHSTYQPQPHEAAINEDYHTKKCCPRWKPPKQLPLSSGQ